MKSFTSSMILSAAALLVGGCSSLLAPEAALSLAEKRLPLRRCELPNVGETVLCGELPVPENPAQPDGRKISLFVVVLPALSATPQPDALTELAGGPGNAATDYAGGYTRDYRSYRRDRDVLLVDQRGMGRSNPLSCEELSDYRWTRLFRRWPLEAVKTCRDRLAHNADLTQYSTRHAADDLEAVRKWLNYSQLNLFTYSYSTRLALAYMQRYPESVRSAILWGVVMPDFRRPLYYARDSQRAMTILLDECRADVACARAFPNVHADLTDVLADLERAPVPTMVIHPATRESVPVTITRFGFAESLWELQFYPGRAREIPMIIHHAARGNMQPFLTATVAKSMPRRPYYNGVHLSIVCPEETQHVRPEEIDALHAGTFLPAAIVLEYVDACRAWNLPTLPADTLAPVSTDVPTLIVTGYMDHITPPHWGERALRGLASGRHVVIRDLAHEADGLADAECLDQMFLRFLAQPEPNLLDVRCTEKIAAPPFVLTPSPGARVIR